MRDSIVFYRSYWDAIKNLPEEAQLLSLKAILEYGFDGTEPEIEGIAKAIFLMARPQIDVNNKRYENGKKGGKPKNNQVITKSKPKRNQKITKTEPNVNVNANVNVNENELDNNSAPSSTSGDLPTYQYAEVIDYLNGRAGTHFKHSSADTKMHIKARFDEGYSLEDFKTVIDKKTAEWKGTEQEKYLRPSTLFGTKFESYLNQHITGGKARSTGFSNFQQRDYDFDDLERRLLESQKGE